MQIIDSINGKINTVFTLFTTYLTFYILLNRLTVISITSCIVNGKDFSLILVSRRSKERAGTRLFTRGVDSKGYVANFVETEQIVETAFGRASFVQVKIIFLVIIVLLILE